MRLPACGHERERPSARARPDHGAAAKFNDTVEHVFALPSIVQHDQRGTASNSSFCDDFIHQFDALRVEVVVRLVEKQQTRRTQNQSSQREAALHPGRKPAHSFVA